MATTTRTEKKLLDRFNLAIHSGAGGGRGGREKALIAVLIHVSESYKSDEDPNYGFQMRKASREKTTTTTTKMMMMMMKMKTVDGADEEEEQDEVGTKTLV